MELLTPVAGNGFGFYVSFGRSSETVEFDVLDPSSSTLDTQTVLIPQNPDSTFLGWTCGKAKIAQVNMVNNPTIAANLDYAEVTNVTITQPIPPPVCTVGIYYDGYNLTSISVTNEIAPVTTIPQDFVSIPVDTAGPVTVSWTPDINGVSTVSGVACDEGCFTGVILSVATATKKREVGLQEITVN